MRRPLRSVAIAVMSASLILLACSSPSTSTESSEPVSSASPGQTAVAYVVGFCKAFAAYEKQLQLPSERGSDPKALKQELLTFWETEISATQHLVIELEALGTPAVAGGAQVSTALVHGFTTAESEFRSIRDAVASLPTSNQSAFEKAFNRLSRQVDQDLKGTALAANPFRSNPELLAAFRSAPQCAASTNESSGAPVSSPVSTNG